MSEIRVTTLENGLRVVTDTVPDVHSAAVGLWVGVGTRHEDLRHNGVAHMVEHMLFKGTKRRTTRQIAEEVENVGGHMNAYTSKEMTSYYIHLLRNDVRLALDMLADMYQHAALPPEEVERERGVILQEIGLSYDTPDDIIFDNYYETAYPQQGLGAPILGRAENISGMQRATIENYIKDFYTPARTIISVAGNIAHEDIVRHVKELFTALPDDRQHPETAAVYKGGETRREKELEQAHVILGFRGLNRLDEDYHVAQALSTLLGGGMSSRLFQEVREKRGLVYSIYSFHSGYADNGQFGIYAGTGEDSLPELVPVVCGEILRAMENITEEETMRAKTQIKAGLLIGRESMIGRADQQAKYLHYRGLPFSLDAVLKKIDSIHADDVRRVAKKIFSGAPTLAALGPVGKLESFESVKKRLSA
ncbi:MAG: insulinase family protein [Alphaproteobacteria bacterium]|nr:insulinase family protein [Alphaproteobacteria bacterium]